ncbi:neuropeptide FF receptor 1-like [Actinia tenebrosa]|uniref:Neuropeptide FF receptor 1-like n=1 Tax=Actinia tenebrosa TaxID=6105 RepID=A0A6P8HJG0_ACTTE|nr:neuropeptide FF receptor 1-like [Actinia tenebrosa]
MDSNISTKNGSSITTISYSKELIFYEVVAFLIFAGNLLVCVLFARKKVLLRKTYNIYFLILSITDLLISFALAMTPLFILSDILPFSLHVRSAGSICRVLWSRWLLYTLGIFSIYICLLLTIERWFAVVKPLSYQGNFNKKKVTFSLVCAASLALMFTSSTIIETTYSQDNIGAIRCRRRPISELYNRAWGLCRFLGECLIPSFIMLGLFIHVILKTHCSVAPMFDVTDRRLSNMGRTSQTQKAVIKMIGTATFFMILCCLPNQTLYLLSKFGHAEIDTPLHHYLEVLTFFNSCINPAIYGITSKTFRKGYWEILLRLCPPRIRVRLAQTRGGLGESLGSVVFLVHAIHRRKSYDWRFEGMRPATTTNLNPSVLSATNL